MIRSFLVVIILSLLATPVFTQNDQERDLALEYYRKGDYEKAAVLFEKLFDKGNTAYYKYYFNCLIALEDYEETEKVVRKQIRKFPDDLQYLVDLGYLYYTTGNPEKAYGQYQEAIDKLSPNRSQIARLANGFNSIKEYKYAIETYLQGRNILKDYKFNNELANLYANQGEVDKMISHYLDYVDENPEQMQQIQTSLQRSVSGEKDFDKLQSQLYERIQKQPNNVLYPELLIWNFIQLKDFESALIQVKALHKRFREDGTRVYELGQSAQTEENFDAAIDAYQFLVDEGPENIYYYAAKNNLLKSRKSKVLLSSDYTMEDILQLQNGYELFIKEYSRKDPKQAATIQELAHLEAFYIHDLAKASGLLEEVIKWPSLSIREKSDVKLDLGDYYLMDGEIWDATLLYSQVDKSMKDEPLGEEARYKNAKLTYYNGDFEWAQTQLDVLKASTSELVANDALNLSVFITENLGLDTTLTPMQMFARADLLAFQNRYDEARLVLDSLDKEFPGHTLLDNVLYLRAEMATKIQEYLVAAEMYDEIRSNYPDDILVDDALFKLGGLYENQLNDPDKAKECYQEIILRHKDSIYVIEARKRFRKLRGDAF